MKNRIQLGDYWKDRGGYSWYVASIGEKITMSGPGPCRGCIFVERATLEQGPYGWTPTKKYNI